MTTLSKLPVGVTVEHDEHENPARRIFLVDWRDGIEVEADHEGRVSLYFWPKLKEQPFSGSPDPEVLNCTPEDLERFALECHRLASEAKLARMKAGA